MVLFKTMTHSIFLQTFNSRLCFIYLYLWARYNEVFVPDRRRYRRLKLAVWCRGGTSVEQTELHVPLIHLRILSVILPGNLYNISGIFYVISLRNLQENPIHIRIINVTCYSVYDNTRNRFEKKESHNGIKKTKTKTNNNNKKKNSQQNIKNNLYLLSSCNRNVICCFNFLNQCRFYTYLINESSL